MQENIIFYGVSWVTFSFTVRGEGGAVCGGPIQRETNQNTSVVGLEMLADILFQGLNRSLNLSKMQKLYYISPCPPLFFCTDSRSPSCEG